MNRETFLELKGELRGLRKDHVVREGQRVPKSIIRLEEALLTEKDPVSRYDLYQLIRSECFEAGLPALEIKALRACAEELNDEPVPWISLADALRFTPATIDEAKRVAEAALDKALRANRFVRYALTTKARIAADAKDYPLLANTLSQLIADSTNRRNEDGPFDVDFLESIPPGVVDNGIIQRYFAIARRSSRE